MRLRLRRARRGRRLPGRPPDRGPGAAPGRAGPRATRVISVYVTGGATVPAQVVALAKRTRAPPAGHLDARRRPRRRRAAALPPLGDPPGRPGRRPAPPRRAAEAAAADADPAPDARAEHPLVRLVGDGQPQHAGRVRGGVEARAARGEGHGGPPGAADVGPLRRAASPRRPRTRSRPTSRASRRSTWSAPAATTSATSAAWRGPSRDALFEDAYRQISALAPKPFWIAETGSTSKRREPGEVAVPAGGHRHRDPEPAGRGLVRRARPQRRLPRQRDQALARRLQGLRRTGAHPVSPRRPPPRARRLSASRAGRRAAAADARDGRPAHVAHRLRAERGGPQALDRARPCTPRSMACSPDPRARSPARPRCASTASPCGPTSPTWTSCCRGATACCAPATRWSSA